MCPMVIALFEPVGSTVGAQTLWHGFVGTKSGDSGHGRFGSGYRQETVKF